MKQMINGVTTQKSIEEMIGRKKNGVKEHLSLKIPLNMIIQLVLSVAEKSPLERVVTDCH